MMLPKKGMYPALERTGFLMPVKVSMSENGKIQTHGTKAFVPIGTEFPCGGSPSQKKNFLSSLAHQSPFFTKAFSLRQQRIVTMLEAEGIETEKFLLATKDGRAVFEKSGYSLDSDRGMEFFSRNFWDNVDAVETMVAKTHSLGITHQHLHGGNITIDAIGKIRIIDWGNATVLDFGKLKTTPKYWALKKFFPDLKTVSGLLWAVGKTQIYADFREHVFRNIVGAYSRELKKKIGMDDFFELQKGYTSTKERMNALEGNRKILA